MVLGDVLDTVAGHLEDDEAGRGPLVKVEGAELALVHAGGGRVVGHEDEAAQVGPAVDDVLEGAHHPRGEAAALVVLEDEDVGEVGKGDVVGDDAAQAGESAVGAGSLAREATVALHLGGRVGDGVDGQGHAVGEHLAHLVNVEGVVPPHEVRVKDVVDDKRVEKGLVRAEEEAVTGPVTGRTLLLERGRLGRAGLGLGGCSLGGHG